jgi:predicted lipoprotein with Yx(FWY)xxD motif
MSRAVSTAALALVLLAMVAGCASSEEDSDPAGARLETAPTEFGPVITDQDGHTLYLLLTDRRSAPTCIEECTGLWAPAEYREGMSALGDVDASLIGSVTREDGLIQLTYNSWPLYRYRGDAQRGDIEGHGQLNVWFAIGAAGEAVGVTE